MEDKTTCNCVKKPFQVIFMQDPAPDDNFLLGFGFIPSSPHSPPLLSNVVPKKVLISTHFAQNSTLFGVGGCYAGNLLEDG